MGQRGIARSREGVVNFVYPRAVSRVHRREHAGAAGQPETERVATPRHRASHLYFRKTQYRVHRDLLCRLSESHTQHFPQALSMGFSLCIRPTKSSSRMASASRIVCSLTSHTQFLHGVRAVHRSLSRIAYPVPTWGSRCLPLSLSRIAHSVASKSYRTRPNSSQCRLIRFPESSWSWSWSRTPLLRSYVD
ncbi:hypothetical protein BDD12DRAFT_224014 [Trichophaea hybrida]|nr:hypothetical protein BDD12DRAFT_224014 [Trichophaea hybrida]